MWGYPFHGRKSIFGDRHRVLFSISSNDSDRRNLSAALRLGSFGLFVSAPDDSMQLAAAKTALRDLFADVTRATRADVCIVCQCSSTWTRGAMAEKCRDLAAKLNVDAIDVVLFPAALLPPQVDATKVRTADLVAAWDAMVGLVDAGVARHIGVCDFAIHEIEVLLTRFPTHPIEIQCLTHVTPFAPQDHMTRFCHAKQMDVLACFSVEMESLSHKEKERWKAVAGTIAKQHSHVHVRRTLPSETVRDDAHRAAINQGTVQGDVSMGRLKTPSEVLATWLNQRGLIAVPMVEGDEPYEESLCETLFSLSHPLVRDAAAAAPTKPYQFVLTRDEMKLIAQTSAS
ncbi:Aste57867_5612 [Aphanomyces stellatus]|uniref:Aste57867_5612 protein n=1 Tax=Aphanomyces stellatus TaxID=120398 RepID=A0A485KFM6_9STRA|nr:hypothetical protein As57867_005599 [Aphanomyces stellatus]VFT82658.1 Aste57867_5612 [Aphanomyces stellatus]